MIKRKSPTITQANILIFITAVVTLAGSAFFQPRLGIGTNVWINEFVYILFPPLLIARIKGWSIENVYRLKTTSLRNKIVSIFSGSGLWLFAFYVSKIIRVFLDNKIGVLIISEQINPSIYQSLLLVIGMVVLAPICEEIFFRGFVQRAYENHNKKYSFVIAAIIFGAFHVLNGISEVIPATILGLAMGYLLYKTDSITTSMIFHAAANICAVVLGGMFEIYTQARIPVWLHIIAFAGLCLSVVLLRGIKDENQSEELEDRVQKDNRVSITGIIFLVFSMVFLIAVGVFEILVRLEIV